MGLLSDLFGERLETLPGLKTLPTAQQEAIQANIASFSDIAKLATQVNLFNQDQLNALLERVLPGGAAQIRSNLSSQLRGEVPRDVQRQITRFGAERGVGSLTRGSAFTTGATARDLGLTSLAIMDKALTSAESWISRATAPQMDYSSMFISPVQQYSANVDQFNREAAIAKMKAAPDPGVRGLFDTAMTLTGMALSAYGGGPGYQGTYTPDYGGGFGGGTPGSSSTWSFGGGGLGFGTTKDTGGARKWFMGGGPGPG